MKLAELPKEFNAALPVIIALEEAGYQGYFVGGSVRDILLDKPIHDVDIATSAYPEEVKGVFKRTIDVGIEHGTVLVLFEEEQYEITTFRTESAYQDYRRPDQVTFVRSLTEDLKRRDFTINALAMDRSGEIVDLFDGIQDIQNKTIRAVGNASERFHEDALRMLRALRFASQLDFEIAEETLEAISVHHQLLAKISVERIQVEWLKLMMGQKRNSGLQAFLKTNSYECCPGFKDQQDRLKQLLELPEKMIQSEAMVWLILMEVLAVDLLAIREFLQSWKCSNQMIKTVTSALNALRIRRTSDWSPELLYQTGLENIQLVEETLPFFQIEAQKKEAIQAYEALAIQKIQDLAISGKDILAMTEKKPGPWLGSLLQAIEKNVVTGHIENQQDSLKAFVIRQLEETI